MTDLRWFKSSYSGSAGGECVEVAASLGAVHVRDSKEPDGSRLVVSAERWVPFVAFAVRSARTG